MRRGQTGDRTMRSGKRAVRDGAPPPLNWLIPAGAIVALLAVIAAGTSWGLSAFWGHGASSSTRTISTADRSPSGLSDDGEPRVTPNAGSVEDVVVPTEAQMSACRDEQAAVVRVVAAATRGADHWRGHIDAQAAWADGKITEEQKKARYKATRLAGPNDIERYESAIARLDDTDVACDALPGATEPAQACQKREQALVEAMAAGEVAIMDWKAHLDNMAAFAEEEFGVSHAQMLWEESFAGAPTKLAAFDRAKLAVREAPRCG
jgi:hypothetical protein